MEIQETKIPIIYRAYFYLKNIPVLGALTETPTWRRLRYKLTLLLSQRRSCSFTSFLRMPTQFEALCGPVLDFLLEEKHDKKIRIIVLGCSNGAEAYSIASVLKSQHPDLPFEVYASDIDREAVYKARSARYTFEEIFNNEVRPAHFEDFVNATFDEKEGVYVVKPDIRNHIHFDIDSVLDENLTEKIGTAYVVYAQHLLIHLKPRDQKKAFGNICNLLNPKAALFVAGNEYDFIQNQTRKKNLAPLVYKIEEIHKEVGMYGQGWPWVYWGVEPFQTIRKDWERRYGTIFLKHD